MSTLLLLARSAPQKTTSKGMALDTHSSDQGNGGRLSGVGFMVSTSIASRLENLPTGHSDRMMSMRLHLKNKRYATLFSVYVPSLRDELAEKDKFYSELCSCLQSTPADDKVIILGDFNARVGQDADSRVGQDADSRVGQDAGKEHLADTALVTATTAGACRWSFALSSNLFVHCLWHLIKDVIHTKVMPSAECHTDHRIVHCKLRLHFKPKART